MAERGERKMELIESYLEKTKQIRGMYVLKVSDISKEDELHEVAEQWNHFMNVGIVDAPLMIIPDFSELDYEDVFTFERAMQVLRSKGKVRRKKWKKNSYLFVDINQVIMKYAHDDSVPYQIKVEDMEALDWELYHSK
jgi:hypothetical protein